MLKLSQVAKATGEILCGEISKLFGVMGNFFLKFVSKLDIYIQYGYAMLGGQRHVSRSNPKIIGLK